MVTLKYNRNIEQYTTSLSDFDIVHIGGTSESGTSVMLCKRRRTGTMYKIRCRHDHVPWAEQDILEMLRDLGAPFLPHLRSSFREEGRVHLVLVCVFLLLKMSI